MPLLGLVSLVSFAALASIHDSRAYAVFHVLDPTLALATAQYNAGTFVETPMIGELFAALQAEFDESERWLNRVWETWAVLTGFETIVRDPS